MALGRTKIGRRQKPDLPAEPEAAEPDHELESYLAALAPEESVETTGSGRRFGGSQVYQLRLPLMANEKLKELAAKQNTSPAALARDWIMQHLAEEDHGSPAQQQVPPRTQQVQQPYAEPQGYAEQQPRGGQQYGQGPAWPEDQDTREDFRPVRPQPQSDLEQTDNLAQAADTEITMPRGPQQQRVSPFFR
ncbi:hypothetical protein [Saccharopolyspora taberi]|uniref:CopG family transcriptional regulator n=1 Tax=Saccharopolyspora taberi TaxID=60895 RepID=A0ABN3VMB6_9PSEU